MGTAGGDKTAKYCGGFDSQNEISIKTINDPVCGGSPRDEQGPVGSTSSGHCGSGLLQLDTLTSSHGGKWNLSKPSSSRKEGLALSSPNQPKCPLEQLPGAGRARDWAANWRLGRKDSHGMAQAWPWARLC